MRLDGVTAPIASPIQHMPTGPVGGLGGVGTIAPRPGGPIRSGPISGPIAAPDPRRPTTAMPNTFKNGGTVKKTGIALVHKGETVVPASEPVHKESDVSFHRAMHHLNHGGLHRALGIPEDQDIPKDRIAAAKGSTNPHVRVMATLAQNMSHWGKR